MSKTILFDLDHNRKRLAYYQDLKEKSGVKKAAILDKWIEIYDERVRKLERQVSRLGLKTQLNGADKSTQILRA